jgi:hypothetical protein
VKGWLQAVDANLHRNEGISQSPNLKPMKAFDVIVLSLNDTKRV